MKKIKLKLQKLQPLSEILQLYAHGLMPLDVAVARSGLSKRTFQRRMQIWRQGGPAALEHGNSGRKAINRLSDTVRAQIIALIQNKYWDHGPTLLSEQLLKYEGIKISRETARKLIKEAFNDKGFEPRAVTEHPLRRRRGALGELIQIDGSPHHWFGQSAPAACLIGFIDDATSRIMAAKFFPTESFEGYAQVINQYLHRHGIPIALYSDRHSIFRSTKTDKLRKWASTQFSRICQSLGIELIFAQSPNAKGRVERMFGTLQRRWPQMFRVEGITNIEQANMRIDEFIESHNTKFAIAPTDERDAHAPISESQWEDVDRICAVWHERTVSKSLTVSLPGQMLQIVDVEQRRWSLMKQQVHVIEYQDGRLEILWHTPEGEEALLNFKVFPRLKLKRPKALKATAKTIDHELDEIVKAEMHAPNAWIKRHEKEGLEGVQRAQRREQKQLEFEVLKDKLTDKHGAEKAAQILGLKK